MAFVAPFVAAAGAGAVIGTLPEAVRAVRRAGGGVLDDPSGWFGRVLEEHILHQLEQRAGGREEALDGLQELVALGAFEERLLGIGQEFTAPWLHAIQMHFTRQREKFYTRVMRGARRDGRDDEYTQMFMAGRIPGRLIEEFRCRFELARRRFRLGLVPGSVYSCLSLDAIMHFFIHPQNMLYIHISNLADHHIRAVARSAPPRALSEVGDAGDDDLPGRAIPSRLTHAVPWVMDQSCREPATTTPFGHTADTKWKTLQIVRGMGVVDIAICGLYYGRTPTPECLFLEHLRHRADHPDNMAGTIAMFPPCREVEPNQEHPQGQPGRDTALRLMEHYHIPNGFLDVTIRNEVPLHVLTPEGLRQRMEQLHDDVMDAVVALDDMFDRMDLPREPWREDESMTQPCMGEVTVNLVDVMEFICMREGRIVQARWDALVVTLQRWRENNVFQRRVVGILTEEARGLATARDHREVVERLRGIFPRQEQYRIAIHCHAGVVNAHDVASVECMQHSESDGVWAAMIPQAAQNGHNNWLTFLDTLIANGNRAVMNNFQLRYAVNAARQIYFLNFNTVQVPDGPTIWGQQASSVHPALDEGDPLQRHWRARDRLRFCHFQSDHRGATEEMRDITLRAAREEKLMFDPDRVVERKQWRIAPLVSDWTQWQRRMNELLPGRLPQQLDDQERLLRRMMGIAYAIMNANVRADFNCRETLSMLYHAAHDDRHYRNQMYVLESCKGNH